MVHWKRKRSYQNFGGWIISRVTRFSIFCHQILNQLTDDKKSESGHSLFIMSYLQSGLLYCPFIPSLFSCLFVRISLNSNRKPVMVLWWTCSTEMPFMDSQFTDFLADPLYCLFIFSSSIYYKFAAAADTKKCLKQITLLI